MCLLVFLKDFNVYRVLQYFAFTITFVWVLLNPLHLNIKKNKHVCQNNPCTVRSFIFPFKTKSEKQKNKVVFW